MKNKLLILLLLLSTGAFAQNRLYNLTTQFDSVKVRKLLMTSIATGSATDSILVKKPNGGVFKIARSSLSGNYVDLSSNQNVAGVKNWTDDAIFQKRVYARGFAFPINGTDPAYAADPYSQLYAIPADQSATGLRFKASSAVSSPNVITDLIFNSTVGRKITFQNKDYTVAGLDDLTPYVKQSGNAFGTTMTVGTTDVNDFNLIRNGVVNFQITVNGANFPLGAKASVNNGGSNDLVRNADAGFKQVKTASGNGSSTTIIIAHGLTGITTSSYVTAMANNAASSGIQYVTVDATNINIFYTVAPVSGTNNLLYSISIKP